MSTSTIDTTKVRDGGEVARKRREREALIKSVTAITGENANVYDDWAFRSIDCKLRELQQASTGDFQPTG